jgi:hypothetical protein
MRLACLALLCSPTLAAAQELVFDLSPFDPGSAVGELIGVSTASVEVISARIDATLVVQDTGPWSMSVAFHLPSGFAGLSSTDLGWSGPGTFSTSFVTDAFDGPLAPPEGQPFFTWFLTWSGGVPFSLPGGGQGIGPLDGQFTTLRLVLELAPCPGGDPQAPWTALGGGVGAGGGPAPVLTGTGSLCPGEPLALSLTGGAPGAVSFLVAGASELSLPLFGATLVPAPDVIFPAVLLDGAGAANTPFLWPAGVPSGVSLWLQQWVVDVGGPVGLTASNGLRGTAP